MSTPDDITMMKVLYVRGAAADADESTLLQLRAQAAELDITVAISPTAALAELRRTRGWHALLLSPALPHNEVLALVATIRRDRVAVAIVPVVDEAHQDVFASAVAAGADDVLMRRGQTLVNVAETLTRIWQSPHLFPAEQRRKLTVLYAGRDPLVWNLLEQVPFVKAEKVTVGPDGSCPVRTPGTTDGALRCDAVVIDEQPGEVHPLQILKSVKAQASDLAVVVLTSSNGGDIATAALDLGADDTVLKTGVFRRRLVATLRRVHQRIEIAGQQIETKAREERLRHIVETVPAGITVIAADGAVLAMNAAALQLFGATKPREIVGRDVRQFVTAAHHDAVADFVRRVLAGEATAIELTALTLAGHEVEVRLHGVTLERDARGSRGIVASISTATGQTPLGGVSTTGELAELRERVDHVQAQSAELDATYARERTAWDEERRGLAARLGDTERALAAQGALAATAEETAAELVRLRDASAHDREALDALTHELDTATRQAADARAAHGALTETFASASARLRELDGQIAGEREAWQQEKTALDARMRSLETALTEQAAHASGVSAIHEELDTLRAAHAQERGDLQTQIATLEHELRQAREALWAEHGERDATRERFDAEVRTLRDHLANERVEWEHQHAQADDQLRAVREQAAGLERDLAAAQGARDADRQRALDDFDGERHDWQAARVRLEEEAAGAASRAEALDGALAGLRAQLEQARAEARDAVAAERQRLAADHADEVGRLRLEHDARVSALDDDARQTRERTAALEAELESARAAQGTAYEEIHRQLADERAGWQDARTRLEADGHAAAARAAALEADLGSMRAQLDAASDTAAQERSRIAAAHDETLDRLRAEHDARASALEGELAQARDRMNDLEAELASTHAQLDAVRHDGAATLEDAQRAWDAARHDLEQQIEAARQHADAAQRDLEAARAAHDSSRQIWDSSRASLEDELHRTRDGHETGRREWDAARDDLARQIDEERRAGAGALASARAEWDAERDAQTAEARARVEHLQAELGALQTAFAGRQAEWHEQHASLDGLLRRAHEDVDSLQRELEATQAQLERDRADARQTTERERAEWESARVALEAALDAARAEILHTDAMHAEQRAAWDADRAASDAQAQDRDAAIAGERDEWARERAAFDALGREADEARQHGQRLEDALNALRSDYASMVQSLNTERAAQEHRQHEIAALRGELADAERRHAERRQVFEQAAREADLRAAQREEAHATRLRLLETELVASAQRLARVTEEAESARLTLQSEYLRASEGHTRLTSSGLFAYAVTTLPGELVRCNDAFARLFGFEDAPDALTQTAGQLFPGLADRPAFAARLSADGHVHDAASCVERHDGQAISIVESATLLVDGDQIDDEALVEHVIVGTPAGPDPDELRARRLEEVGALATAMLPDVETLAATAHERAHDLRRRLRDGEHGGDAESLSTLASQINALVRQLATFSRRQTRDVEPVDLAEAVTRTEPVLVRLVGDYVGFALHLSPAPPVLVNRDDLDQLLTSLVTFARDLLPAGGSLSVEVRPPAAGRGDTDGPAATVLSVTASGYGVQLPAEAPSLDSGARRCGGRLHLSGDPGWTARLDVHFARCGGPARSAWSWDRDGN